jgi:carboxymethylenebutenolidase
MLIVRRVLVWTFGVIFALMALLAVSIPVDALLGRGRVDALTNMRIPNAGGVEVRAYVARPETPGPHPAVIMIHEWWGLTAEMIGKADALAREGYVVVAPDTFRGGSTGWIPRAIYQVSTTPPEQVNGDLDAVFAWLVAQPDVLAERIGVMGFCYGGRTSLLYSLHNDNLAATAIFYGMAQTDPQQLRALPGPVLGIFGGADSSIPVEEVRELEAGLGQAGIPSQITIYADQPPAFVKSIDEIRQGGPQQEAWNELLDFLRRTLRDQVALRSTNGAQFDGRASFVTISGALHHRLVCALGDV